MAIAIGASLLVPAAADGHALFADHDPNRPLAEYLWLGFVHMAGGWDHLLFIAGVVLLAGSARSAAKLISLFVAGHSLTLIVATLAGWQLDATAVDVVIALSLVFVGVWGIRDLPRSALFAGGVFGFGLVHGLGLATRLQDVALPEDGVLLRVVLFNVGVQLGQLAALGLIAGVGRLVARRAGLGARDARPVYVALVGAGVLAAAVLSFPGAPSEPADVSACVRRDASPPRALAGGHPERFYYAPHQRASQMDLDHVVADGLVVVRYRPDPSARRPSRDRAARRRHRAAVPDRRARSGAARAGSCGRRVPHAVMRRSVPQRARALSRRVACRYQGAQVGLTVLVFAHAGHWLAQLAYPLPLILLIGALLYGRLQERRKRARE